MNERDFDAALAGAIHYDFHGTELTIAGVKHPAPHFRYLAGDVDFVTYGGKWVSKPFSAGKVDYYLVIELNNLNTDWGSDKKHSPTYQVTLSVVSPSEAGEQHIRAAFESCGLPDDFIGNKLIEVEALHGYGILAEVWSANGNNWRKLMAEAHRMTLFVNTFLGFFMDEAQNLLGNTGWNFIRGEVGFGHATTGAL